MMTDEGGWRQLLRLGEHPPGPDLMLRGPPSPWARRRCPNPLPLGEALLTGSLTELDSPKGSFQLQREPRCPAPSKEHSPHLRPQQVEGVPGQASRPRDQASEGGWLGPSPPWEQREPPEVAPRGREPDSVPAGERFGNFLES